MVKIKYLIFDWGNTVMRDLDLPGPMKEWERIENIPGIENALSELQLHYKLVIATSAPHSNTSDMKEALTRGGLQGYFQHFFSSKELGASKPDPEFFKQILLKLDCDASEALSIGDKYPNDVEAAKRSGIKAVWFNEKNISLPHPDADAVMHQMSELPGKIKELSV